MRRAFAECLGTFCLVFAGCGAIVIDGVTGGAVGHLGIALTFGLVVMAMIYALGDVSGAHLNPAVTLAFAAAGRLPWREVAPYALGQVAGAFAATGLLAALFPAHATLGATIPFQGLVAQAFFLEVVLSAILMFTILNVSTGAQEKGAMAGVAVGGVIALEALFAGPLCGASMNPARSLAPALLSGETATLWVYMIAPVLGTLLAVPCCRGVHAGACCRLNGNGTCAP